MSHTLPKLDYAYSSLEPFIDARTMEIHHTKHHQTYIDKLNAALKGHDALEKLSVEKLIRDLNAVPEAIRTAVRNHGGGHANHSFFWPILKRGGQGRRPGGGRHRKKIRKLRQVQGGLLERRRPSLRERLGLARGEQRQSWKS